VTKPLGLVLPMREVLWSEIGDEATKSWSNPKIHLKNTGSATT